jgi:hypothetical protein
LLDTFADPSAFASGWTVMAQQTGTSPVTNAARLVTIAPVGNSLAMIVASSGEIGGPLSVQVLADTDHTRNASPQEAKVMAVSGADLTAYYNCGVDNLGVIAGVEDGPLSYESNTGFSDLPVDDHLALRLSVAPALGGGFDVACRLDFGRAVGGSHVPVQPALAGGAGVATIDATAAVRAIAVYRFQPGVACPAPIYR